MKVRSWMVDEDSNLGLHVVVRTLGGSTMDMKMIRFASGRTHHQSKQPMLVLFTDDGRRATTLESLGEIQGNFNIIGPNLSWPSDSKNTLSTGFLQKKHLMSKCCVF